MADDSSGLSVPEKWEALSKEHANQIAKFPKTLDAVGKRCAVAGCPVTRGISYSKPLCYDHWKGFDSFCIEECARCRWFEDVEDLQEQNGLQVCFDCLQRESKGASPAAVYVHDKIEQRIRYLYFLKLSNGRFYIGQTNDLELRLSEHRDGMQKTTKGLDPKLVYFKSYEGNQDELNKAEDYYTYLLLNNPRAIRRIVAAWQSPLRLVTIGAF